MKNLTDFRKAVETGVDPRLEAWHYLKSLCKRGYFMPTLVPL